MKNRFSLCVFTCLLTILAETLPAQPFQTDFGYPSSDEIAWDEILESTGIGVTLINSEHSTNPSIRLTAHNPLDGRPIWSIRIVQSRERRFESRALANWPSKGPTKNFYVTGLDRAAISTYSNAFLLQTGPPANMASRYIAKLKSEKSRLDWGVSLEEDDHHITFVAGNSQPGILRFLKTQPGYFWAARFDGNLTNKPVWSYHYFVSDTARLHFSIAESCLGAYQIPRGLENRGLAVVGHYYRQGEKNRHTFVSMIDFNSGKEIWRTTCPSDFPVDAGESIVYDPIHKWYVIAGYATGNDGRKRLYLCIVDNAGNFLGGNVFEASPGNRIADIHARDLCISRGKKSVVATGYIAREESGIKVYKTFAAELPLDIRMATPLWAYYYEESFPDLPGSEAIREIASPDNFSPGYLITTGGRLGRQTTGNSDAQILKTDPSGTIDPLREKCGMKEIKLDPQIQQTQARRFKFTQKRIGWITGRAYVEEVSIESTSCEE